MSEEGSCVQKKKVTKKERVDIPKPPLSGAMTGNTGTGG